MFHLLALCLLTSLSTMVQTEDATQGAAVKKLAEQMADATVKGDYGKVIDSTYETIVKQLGGREKAIETTKKLMDGVKSQGVTIKSFTVKDAGKFYMEGKNTFVVLPTALVLTTPQAKVEAKSYLLGISGDKGKTWKFVDGTGIDKNINDKLLPTLPSDLKLPAKEQPKITKD